MKPTKEDFISEIRALCSENVHLADSSNYVLFIGGTGSGKSTILNLYAGSQIKCELNDCGEWEMEAHPKIAAIGNSKTSETFIPNSWKHPLTQYVVYDCPGFKQNRSIEHEIAKSSFLKRIKDSCENFKILVIGDISELKATRGGTFISVVNQIKYFLPDFDFIKDCQIIITKVPRKLKKMNIKNLLKKLEYDFPEEKIHLFYEPDDDTFQVYPLNVQEIIQAAPSCESICQLPLSSQAKIKLRSVNDEYDSELKSLFTILLQKIQSFYLELLAGEPQIKVQKLKEYNRHFKGVYKSIKKLESVEFIGDILKGIDLQLNEMKKIDLKELLFKIEHDIGEMIYLNQISNEILINPNCWVVELPSFIFLQKQHENTSTIKNIQQLKIFLKQKFKASSASIDFNLIKKYHEITIPVKEEKIISGTATYNENVKYSEKRPYSFTYEYFQEGIRYKGTVQLQGKLPYTAQIQIPKCSIYSRRSQNCDCNRYRTKEIEHEDYVNYKETLSYYGYVDHLWKKDFTGQTICSGNVKVTGPIEYQNQKIFLDKNISKNCRKHIKCYCRQIAQIITAINLTFVDINYYCQVMKKNHERYECNESLSILENANNLISMVCIEGNLYRNSFNMNFLSHQIHSMLSSSTEFEIRYDQSLIHNIKKPYCGRAKFSDTQKISDKVSLQHHIPYEGKVKYDKDIHYSGSISVKDCYFPYCQYCSYRNDTTRKRYSGYKNIKGQQNYKGTVYRYHINSFEKSVTFEGDVPYANIATCSEKVNFAGTKMAVCPKGELGSGHHNETLTLSTLNQFINILQKLLVEKETILSLFESNQHKEPGQNQDQSQDQDQE